MNDNRPQIPEMNSLAEIAEFWDTHDLADYWDQTEPAEFEVSPNARRRYLVALDSSIISRVHNMAHQRGISTESLVNLLLDQRLREVEAVG